MHIHHHPDDEEFGLATPDDACREQAIYEGAKNTTRAWVLTSYDSWRANPFYTGPAVPHPESDHHEAEEESTAQFPAGDELTTLPTILIDIFGVRAFRADRTFAKRK